MEALIKGTAEASTFGDLIMIADNGAPIKDISLLKGFKIPVHIIVCGSYDGEIHPDYLKVARKTKGSVHTMEDDLKNLAAIAEGGHIEVGGTKYYLMGGEFVRE